MTLFDTPMHQACAKKNSQHQITKNQPFKYIKVHLMFIIELLLVRNRTASLQLYHSTHFKLCGFVAKTKTFQKL